MPSSSRSHPPALERGRVTVLSRNPERIARLVPEIHSVPMVSGRAFWRVSPGRHRGHRRRRHVRSGDPPSGRLSSVRVAGGRIHGQGRRALLGWCLSGHAGCSGLGTAPCGSKGAPGVRSGHGIGDGTRWARIRDAGAGPGMGTPTGAGRRGTGRAVGRRGSSRPSDGRGLPQAWRRSYLRSTLLVRNGRRTRPMGGGKGMRDSLPVLLGQG